MSYHIWSLYSNMQLLPHLYRQPLINYLLPIRHSKMLHQLATAHQAQRNDALTCFSKFPLELAFRPWRLQGLPLWFQTQKQPQCLFKSHTVIRYYIMFYPHYIISKCYISSLSFLRLWTHSLIAPNIVSYSPEKAFHKLWFIGIVMCCAIY